MINEKLISKIALYLDLFCGIGWLSVTVAGLIDSGVNYKTIVHAIICIVWFSITVLEFLNCKEFNKKS